MMRRNSFANCRALLFVFASGVCFSTTAFAQDRQGTSLDELLNGKSGIYQVLESDDAETRLLKQRVNVAQSNLDQNLVRFDFGSDPIEFIVGSQEKLLVAQLEFLKDPAQIHSAINKVHETYKQLETDVRNNFEEGKVPLADMTAIMYARLDCEIRLLRARKEIAEEEEHQEDKQQEEDIPVDDG